MPNNKRRLRQTNKINSTTSSQIQTPNKNSLLLNGNHQVKAFTSNGDAIDVNASSLLPSTFTLKQQHQLERNAYLLTLTKDQLKAECRKRGQKSNGTKTELVYADVFFFLRVVFFDIFFLFFFRSYYFTENPLLAL